jgi:dihydroxy-acid dehydratase
MAILSELNKGGLLDTTVGRVDYPTLADAMADNDIFSGSENAYKYLAAPGGVRTVSMGECERYYEEFDKDRVSGCIRSIENAYMKDGGLAVLYGNFAQKGCIIKTAGVKEHMLTFKGKAVVFESQEEAVNGILGGKVSKGDVVIIRYEGPKGGPGMQEMLYPTSFLKSMHLDADCALVTDGRFSGGTSGLSIGHVSPEAAAGGLIGVVENGDIISIDIPNRSIAIEVEESVLQERIKAQGGKFEPKCRDRKISKALRAYAMLASSADKGGVREL